MRNSWRIYSSMRYGSYTLTYWDSETGYNHVDIDDRVRVKEYYKMLKQMLNTNLGIRLESTGIESV